MFMFIKIELLRLIVVFAFLCYEDFAEFVSLLILATLSKVSCETYCGQFNVEGFLLSFQTIRYANVK